MGLGQVGAVVPGMMRVVVNQSHLLEHKQQVVSIETRYSACIPSP